MSFFDNLENNLKNLEARDSAQSSDNDARDRDRDRAKSEAPWAQRLRADPWTQQLMQKMTRAGFERRTKVNLVWIGNTLRLEARGHRLELRPGTQGIAAVYLQGQDESKREPIDFKEDPSRLVGRWMTIIEVQKKLDEEQAARVAAEFAAD